MSVRWLVAVAAGLLLAIPLFVLIGLFLLVVIPWWGLMGGLFLVGAMILWGACFYDLLRRADVLWWHIGLGGVFLIVVPVSGPFAYFSTRHAASKIRYKGEQVA